MDRQIKGFTLPHALAVYLETIEQKVKKNEQIVTMVQAQIAECKKLVLKRNSANPSVDARINKLESILDQFAQELMNVDDRPQSTDTQAPSSTQSLESKTKQTNDVSEPPLSVYEQNLDFHSTVSAMNQEH